MDAHSGHVQQARNAARRAMDLAQRAGQPEAAATFETGAAVWEAFFGNAATAKRYAMAALGVSKGRDVEYAAAVALALAGDFTRAEALANALEILQAAGPYELAVPGIEFVAAFGGMYPVYVRGEAFLAGRQGAQAVSEFQKILDHHGLVVADPIGALAHLQLGRAYTLSGDKTKAKTAYQDFLTLWKDADPGIPILKQAKTEYAKLQ